MAETRDDARKLFDRALVRFESKYPGAMERLRKDREELLESAQKSWKRIQDLFAAPRGQQREVQGQRTGTGSVRQERGLMPYTRFVQ